MVMHLHLVANIARMAGGAVFLLWSAPGEGAGAFPTWAFWLIVAGVPAAAFVLPRWIAAGAPLSVLIELATEVLQWWV